MFRHCPFRHASFSFANSRCKYFLLSLLHKYAFSDTGRYRRHGTADSGLRHSRHRLEASPVIGHTFMFSNLSFPLRAKNHSWEPFFSGRRLTMHLLLSTHTSIMSPFITIVSFMGLSSPVTAEMEESCRRTVWLSLLNDSL